MGKQFAVSAVFRPDQLAGGVYRFVENLLGGFSAIPADTEFQDPFSMTVFQGRTPLPCEFPEMRMQTVPARLGRFTAAGWVGAIGARGFDAVLFPSYFTPPVVRAARTVTVIHDLQFRHLPRFFSPLKRQWLDACHRWTLAKADAVVAISNVVRDDILNQYGAKYESRVHAIHNPVSLDRFDICESSDQFTGGRPYLMCVAMDRPQKNLHTLIRAFQRIQDRFPDHLLVMAGQLRRLRPDRREKQADIAQDLPSTESLVASLGLSDRVVITGFVSDPQLSGLYRGASAFVLPSLFEGFGMPAAEALALRTPALVSDLPVLREVTLGGARYLENPTSVDELAEQMIGILENVEAVRPTAQLAAAIRDHYAPATIARQYYHLLAK
jgi:glycosyltransferase involved in cell wall biosynthesis